MYHKNFSVKIKIIYNILQNISCNIDLTEIDENCFRFLDIRLYTQLRIDLWFVLKFKISILVLVVVNFRQTQRSTRLRRQLLRRRRVDHKRRRHFHLTNPHSSDQPLRQLLLRLRLRQKPHIDRHARHVPQREPQNRRRDRRAAYIDVDLEVVIASVVIARQRLPEEARAVVPNGRFNHPWPFHDPVHDLEPLVPERVVAVYKPVEERSGGDRLLRREVEHRAVVVFARDLEVHGEDEGLERLAA